MFDNEIDWVEWVNHETELGFDHTYDLAVYTRPHSVKQFLKHVNNFLTAVLLFFMILILSHQYL
jgi:hypothetical protein